MYLPKRRHNHVHVQNNKDEFDRELFEPTHDDWDIMKMPWKAAMDCITKTYTMMMEAFSDMRKVLRRYLYLSIKSQKISVCPQYFLPSLVPVLFEESVASFVQTFLEEQKENKKVSKVPNAKSPITFLP